MMLFPAEFFVMATSTMHAFMQCMGSVLVID